MIVRPTIAVRFFVSYHDFSHPSCGLYDVIVCNNDLTLVFIKSVCSGRLAYPSVIGYMVFPAHDGHGYFAHDRYD